MMILETEQQATPIHPDCLQISAIVNQGISVRVADPDSGVCNVHFVHYPPNTFGIQFFPLNIDTVDGANF